VKPWTTNRVENGLLLVFAGIALTFIPLQPFGFYMSGWAWLIELAVLAPLVLRAPVSGRAARYLAPYVLFVLYASITLAWTWSSSKGFATLAQFIVPSLAYLAAWQVSGRFHISRTISTTSLYVLGAAAILVAAFTPTANSAFSQRPATMSVVVLFVVATLKSRSWLFTLFIAAIGLAITLSTGSRMSSAVLIVMLLTSPSLNVRWSGRILLTVLCAVIVFQITKTEQFKERFYFHEDASLTDVLTLSNDVNTAGRRELWPELTQECSRTPITGLGIGNSSFLSWDLSDGTLPHPHNDYLRTYCEVGLAGAIPFWLFFLWAGARSWRGMLIGSERRLHGVAAQLVLALLLFAITDNPIIYTAQFMAPLAVILGLSDRMLSRRAPRSRGLPATAIGMRPSSPSGLGSNDRLARPTRFAHLFPNPPRSPFLRRPSG
jgi:O-antigen ligase